jgi:hypothetical protein
MAGKCRILTLLNKSVAGPVIMQLFPSAMFKVTSRWTEGHRSQPFDPVLSKFKLFLKFTTEFSQIHFHFIIPSKQGSFVSSLSVIFSYQNVVFICHSHISVGIKTDYGLEGRLSNRGRGKIFLFSTASRSALGPNQPPVQWVSGAVSPEVKRPGLEADHSPPSSAEVKNGEAIPPLSYMSSWHSA